MDIDYVKNYLRNSLGLKIGVIGSRDFNDTVLLNKWITSCLHYYNVWMIISGGKRSDGLGADTLAEIWADEHNFTKLIFPPRYDLYPGNVAPLKRNTQIANESDFLLAFWDGKSRGTKDTIDKAWNINKITFIVDYKDKAWIYNPEDYL